jgi:hypothetical protein
MNNSIVSYIRGHKIYYKNDDWYYNNDESIKQEKACVRCNKMPTIEGYDACLGFIEGVKSACCGHGVSKPIIIQDNKKDYGG